MKKAIHKFTKVDLTVENSLNALFSSESHSFHVVYNIPIASFIRIAWLLLNFLKLAEIGSLFACMQQMLRIAMLVLIKLHHCLEFKTRLSKAIRLGHIHHSEHLAAEEFILGMSAYVLESYYFFMCWVLLL